MPNRVGMVVAMEDARDDVSPEPEERYRWVLEYIVEGDLRFISHHDTLRLFRRALSRAAVPVRYSEGFNPHPRMAIPLPRPVGVASQAETLVFETEVAVDAEVVVVALRDHAPTGIRLLSMRRLGVGEHLQPDLVRYRLEADERSPIETEACVRRLLESEVVHVERPDPAGQGGRLVDIRPFIVDLQVEGPTVEFTLRVTNAGSAKPAEIAGLLGYDASSINHRIRRMEVRWRKR